MSFTVNIIPPAAGAPPSQAMEEFRPPAVNAWLNSPRNASLNSPGNTPRTLSDAPLTPRTEGRKTRAMAMSYESRFEQMRNATQSPFKQRVYSCLSNCSYFIDHDCCSCKECKPECCGKVKLVNLGDSIKTMKKCAYCYSGCMTGLLSLLTCGGYACYECHAIKQDRIRAATINPQ
ncbi:MAG: hypothetical protein JSS32_00855 [Verrucomicrobia bacterium]|nr:hypothetical protein [Verrucomicrobiota bacterium]